MLESPTVSIQNGRSICFLISEERMRSRMENSGLGSGEGRGPGGRMAMFIDRRCLAILTTLA